MANRSRRLAFSALRRLRYGRLEVVEGGRCAAFGPQYADLRAEVRVLDPGFWRSLGRGTVGLAERWMDIAWDCDDLVSLGRMFVRELPAFDRVRRLLVPAQRAVQLIPRNTPVEARRNVAAHYDLGNELFGLFLDETMTYSCAVFESPGASLREAQEAKLELACRKLELRSSDHLLEIGTGWGSLAIHAASRYGCQETLRRWRERFLNRAEHAEALGYDRRFRRLWELYLAWCEAGFLERRIGDVQLLLAKPADRLGLARQVGSPAQALA